MCGRPQARAIRPTRLSHREGRAPWKQVVPSPPSQSATAPYPVKSEEDYNGRKGDNVAWSTVKRWTTRLAASSSTSSSGPEPDANGTMLSNRQRVGSLPAGGAQQHWRHWPVHCCSKLLWCILKAELWISSRRFNWSSRRRVAQSELAARKPLINICLGQSEDLLGPLKS